MSSVQQNYDSSLLSIGKYLLLGVLRKMTPRTFCRMRQTCSAINDFAELEANWIQNHLAELRVYENYVEVAISKNKNKKYFFGCDFENVMLRKDIPIAEQLSGFAVDDVILIKYPLPQLQAELVSFFSRTRNPLSAHISSSFVLPKSTQKGGPFATPQFLVDLNPTLINGDLFADAIKLWEKCQSIANDMGMSMGPCWSRLKDFPSVELHESSWRIIRDLLKDWKKGAEMGRCKYAGYNFSSYDSDEYELIIEDMNLEFQFKATTNDVILYKQGRFFNDIPSRSVTKFKVKVYKMINKMGEAAAVLLNEATEERKLHFAFIPKFEDYYLWCNGMF